MKKITIPVTLALSLFSFQPTHAQITQAIHQPQAGDSSIRYFVDTANVVEGANGTGLTWDFTNLQILPIRDTIHYLLPTVDQLTVFPDADLVMHQKNPFYLVSGSFANPDRTFLQLFPDSTLYLGWEESFSADNGPSVMSNPAKLMDYPFVYGNIISDSLAGTFSGFALFNYSGHTNVTAAASGTLMLPTGTYNNVIKIVEQDNITPGYPAKLYNRLITFFDPAIREPLFTIQYAIGGNKVAWINDPILLKSDPATEIVDFSVYPNPSQGPVKLRFTATHANHAVVKICNLAGQEIFAQSLIIHAGVNDLKIDTQLPAGLFSVTVDQAGTACIAWLLRIE
jgi:hypothetical protein